MEFTKILDDIVKYYPIGIDRFDPRYWHHEGTVLRETLCLEKVSAKNYRKWGTFAKRNSKSNGGVLSYDYGAPLTLPSYYGNYLLDKQIIGTITYQREIHFHVSILAPYYTIYGLDKIFIKSHNGLFSDFEPLLVISPVDIYEQWFSILRNEIEISYKSYKFLSFSSLKARPKALSVPAAEVKEGQNASVFNAFFSPEDLTNYKTIGDILYS